jgi:hypothetical protein
MLTQRGSVIFGAALTVCGLMDFVTTTLLCIIVVGIGLASRILADPNYSPRFSLKLPTSPSAPFR